jgi:hypothetical protein
MHARADHFGALSAARNRPPPGSRERLPQPGDGPPAKPPTGLADEDTRRT